MAWYSFITDPISSVGTRFKNKCASLLSTPVYSLTIGNLLTLAGVGAAIYFAPAVYQNAKETFFPEPVQPVEPPPFIDTAIDYGKEQLAEMAEQILRTYNKMWYIGIVSTITLGINSFKSMIWHAIENTRVGAGLTYINSFNPLRSQKSQKQIEKEQATELAEALLKIGKLSNNAYMVTPVVLQDGTKTQMTFTFTPQQALEMHQQYFTQLPVFAEEKSDVRKKVGPSHVETNELLEKKRQLLVS